MLVKKDVIKDFDSTEKNQFNSALEEVLRAGARKMLQVAIESEIAEFINSHSNLVDEEGKRLVARNGYLPERSLVTGLSPIHVRQPGVDDRKLAAANNGKKFTSEILPPYLRRIPSIDNLVPVLYLKGISTGDFPTALSAIPGDSVKGLSSANIVRLKSIWEDQWKEWSKRDLSGREYV